MMTPGQKGTLAFGIILAIAGYLALAPLWHVAGMIVYAINVLIFAMLLYVTFRMIGLAYVGFLKMKRRRE